MSSPSTCTLPAVGSNRPSRIERVVVLPAPLPPSNAAVTPCLTAKLIQPRGRDHSVTDTSLTALSEPTGPISLRTLILIRWVAIAGQASTIVIVHYGLGFGLPVVPALAVVASSALLNLVLIVLRQWA